MNYQLFVKENIEREMKGIDTTPLEDIHYAIRDLIEAKDYACVSNLMQEFVDKNAEPNRLKTILIITKDFKLSEEINNTRKKVLDLLTSKRLLKKRKVI